MNNPPRIYLLDNNAVTDGYAEYLTQSLGVEVEVGYLTDEKILLRGDHVDFDLLIFDRTYRNSMDIAINLTGVCDKDKIIVPVDSFTRTSLEHFAKTGEGEHRENAQKQLDDLARVNAFDYGEVENFAPELSDYIAKRLGLKRQEVVQTAGDPVQRLNQLSQKAKTLVSDLQGLLADAATPNIAKRHEKLSKDLLGFPNDGTDIFQDFYNILKNQIGFYEKMMNNGGFSDILRIRHELSQIKMAYGVALTEAKGSQIKNPLLDLPPDKIDIKEFAAALSPRILNKESGTVIARGEGLANGATVGVVIKDSSLLSKGRHIFVCESLHQAQGVVPRVAGIIAEKGSFADHTAIIASQRGIPVIIAPEFAAKDGEIITMDGASGEIYKGELQIAESMSKAELEQFATKISENSALRVYANADSAFDISCGIQAGAEGIGLVRLENTISKDARDLCTSIQAAKGKPITFRIEKAFAEMQICEIVEAARMAGVVPQILLPQVKSVNDLAKTRRIIEKYTDSEYKLGAMIESPLAAKIADRLAGNADFISFGTNDLTALFYGVRRDSTNIADNTNFVRLSDEVADVVKMAVDKARNAKPDIEIGVCGRHANDPESIAKFRSMGINYVSCTADNIPIAKLASAQAELKQNSGLVRPNINKGL